MSLRWKLVLSIGIPVVVIYGLLIWMQFSTLRETSLINAKTNARISSESWANTFNGQLLGVAQAVDAIAASVAIRPDVEEEELYFYNEQIMDQNDLVAGSSVAFEPGEWKSDVDRFAPYAWESNGSRNRKDLAKEYAYLEKDWYQVGVDGTAGCTEPYDGPVFGSLLVTYSTPVVRSGEVVGVVAADIALLPFQRQLGTDGPENMTTMLASPQGTFIMHPEASRIFTDSIRTEAARTGSDELALWSQDVQKGVAGFQRVKNYPLARDHWLLYSPVEATDWSMAAAFAEEDILAPVHHQLIMNLILMGVGLVLLLAIIAFTGFRIVNPVRKLATAVRQLGQGDLDVRVPSPSGRDEIGALARGFNDMTERLQHNIEDLAKETAARERVESEMRLARKVQEMLLPDAFPALPDRQDVEVWALNEPARVVAGDFFDVIDHGDRITIVMADVSGKGAGPAMFMSMSRTIIRMLDVDDRPLSDLVLELNRNLYPDSHGAMFVTMVILRYETATGRMTMVNGGHPPPIRIMPDGQVDAIGNSTGPLVGAIEDAQWDSIDATLEPGEQLLLYTDGVTEAADQDKTLLGVHGLLELLQNGDLAAQSPDVLCRSLVESVRDREQGQASDDVTILVLKRPV